MSSLSIVEYMHELKEAGFTDRQSEVQARRLELVVDNVKFSLKQDIQKEFYMEDLVHKKDLELEIEKIRSDTAIVKKDLVLAIEKVRTDLELSIEKVRKDLEISIERVRTDLEISIEKVRTDLELSIERLRKDVEVSMEKLRYEMLKFIIWTGVAGVAATAGMLAKGFHWL